MHHCRSHEDGSCDVVYLDGEKEVNVARWDYWEWVGLSSHTEYRVLIYIYVCIEVLWLLRL